MDRFEALRKTLHTALPNLDLRAGEPMAKHTSFKVGGPAALMAFPKDVEELAQVLRLAKEADVRPFFLGKGTNVLAADQGVDMFLIKLAGGLDRLERVGETGLYVGAGVTLAQAANFAADQGLAGLEFAHGIPGTVGGGVFMNAGAYEGEMVQVITAVDCLDENGKLHHLTRDQLDLRYRKSIFSRLPWIITGAELTLEKGYRDQIRAKMNELAQKRKAKQPLDYPSAGSTFKRPAGHYAGALIEQAGLKGATIGGAQVSDKHAGFIVNTGKATSQDILELIRLVRNTVREKTGVTLEPEVLLLGLSLED